jgi:electron transfer flavoprotein beta subunit
MKIIVCLKEVVDTALSLDTGLQSRMVFEEGLPRRLNPDDAAALAIALDLKSQDTTSDDDVEITAVAIGPERVENYLRQALALGAAKAVRIWGEDFRGLSPWRKSRLLSAFISLSGADLVFTGASSMDTGNTQVGPMVAARLALPCVAGVVKLEIDAKSGVPHFTRDVGRGKREVVACSLPAVVTIKGDGRGLPYASLDILIESRQSEIPVLSLADLNINPAGFNREPARMTALMAPRPRPRKVVTPESSLPAFDRILKLLEGGISKRQGKMLEGSPEELADQLFELLIDEGVIRRSADV